MHYEQYSLRRIKQLIRIPVGVLVIVFSMAVFAIAVHKTRVQFEKVRDEVVISLRSQENLFVSEIFFRREEALKRRVELLEQSFLARFPEEHLQFKLVYTGYDNPPFISGVDEYDIVFHFSLADKSLGYILVSSPRYDGLPSGVTDPALWVALIFATAISLVVVQVLGQLIESRLVCPLLDEVRCKAMDTAIAETSRAFAHDVRKPFSMLLTLLDTLERSSPARVSELINKGSPEVKRALKKVDSMVSDIMNFRHSPKLTLAATDIRIIFSDVLKDVFYFSDHHGLQLSFKFRNERLILADQDKLQRVVQNILMNAVEQVNLNGLIWTETRDILVGDKYFTEVRIGNSGSFIPPEETGKVFDMFFTSRKKSGTGIGLAIVKKMVESHGGLVRCESDLKKGTVFIFTVPSSEAMAEGPGPDFPSASDELIQNSPASVDLFSNNECPANPCEVKSRPDREKSIKIFVVDDDQLFLMAWENIDGFEVRTLSDPERIPEHDFNGIDAIVLDYHFERTEKTGLFFCKNLREKGVSLPVFISSNDRFLSVEEVKKSGASGLIPKMPELASARLRELFLSAPFCQEVG